VRTVRENALAQNTSSEAAASVQQNLPDQANASAGNGNGNGKNSNETNDRREETTNYEVSSRTIETAHDGFNIDRLSIAVLVNKNRLDDVAKQGADALPVEHQLMDIEQLVSAASGFSKDRGDQLKVASVDFVNELGEAAAPEPGFLSVLMAQAGSLFNSLALVVVASVVILFGFKPAIRLIVSQSPQAIAAASSVVAAVEAPRAPSLAAAAPQADGDENVNLIEDVTKRLNRSPQKRLEQIVEYDEAQAAAILRQWLHQDEAA
jgi:flagellar M-ring protein FliF